MKKLILLIFNIRSGFPFGILPVLCQEINSRRVRIDFKCAKNQPVRGKSLRFFVVTASQKMPGQQERAFCESGSGGAES